MPSYGIYARHVKGLEMSNIDFRLKTSDLRPAAIFANVNGLVLDGFKAQVETGIEPVVYKENVFQVTVKDSPK
jgi:hypothetical protein